MAQFSDDDVVIASAVRTPIGRARKGNLVGIRPDELAEQAFAAALAQVPGLKAGDIEDLYLGCAEPHDEHGDNLARRVAIRLGHDTLPGATVNRFCASSLQATRMAFHALRAGEGEAYLVGGVECVSRYQQHEPANDPAYAAAGARTREIAESGQIAEWLDPRDRDEQPDIYIPMGLTAENVAALTGTTREEQDAFAARSQQRASAAVASGFFADEIVPVTLPDGTVVTDDDGPRPGTTVETLAGLNPVFIEQGTVTAGNACPLNDGASAAVIMTGRKARELGIEPLARIISTGVSGLSPEIMGLGPVESSRLALERAGLTPDDLDIVEINEAFAAQVIPSAKQIGVDLEKVNPYGGAIALGHPFGSTGVRMLTTLMHGLREQGGRYGLATLCVGGGQGMAVVVENLR
jgi:acetyl-CoA C-acetyltransferase